ncbi:MAG: hypothetical protein WBW78_14790 [Terrimicrobiaceae bacterium]
MIKHFSRYVQPGARRLDTMSLTGYDNLLVFANPDQSVVILTQNDLSQDLPIRVKAGDKVMGATLQADSFNVMTQQSTEIVALVGATGAIVKSVAAALRQQGQPYRAIVRSWATWKRRLVMTHWRSERAG